MAKKWEYAELTKTASENGGPDAWIASIKQDAYEEGVSDTTGTTILVGGICLIAGGIIHKIWIKGKERIAEKKNARDRRREKAKKAEEQLLDSIDGDMESNKYKFDDEG